MKKSEKYAKVGNVHQVGGIETSVLDNGPGKGVRIAWVNTGSGLRYKVAIDRGLDIVDAFYNQHSLAWLSHAGLASPQPQSDWQYEWLKYFAGGLVTTCGLQHMGPAEEDQYGTRGLHGRISNIPAEVESVIQPDLTSRDQKMSITAVVRESRVFGPCMELRRTISSFLNRSMIRIDDTVTNVGNTPSPHMLLYHINFGWPLVDKGTQILYNGRWQSRDSEMDRAIFNNKNDFRTCPEFLESHRGTGEACAFIEPKADSKGYCTVGLHNQKLKLAVSIRYKKKQLPWLTNWQHFGPNEYVTALEPGTNPPIGQGVARQQKTLLILKPGQSKRYEIEIEVLNETRSMYEFTRKAK